MRLTPTSTGLLLVVVAGLSASARPIPGGIVEPVGLIVDEHFSYMATRPKHRFLWEPEALPESPKNPLSVEADRVGSGAGPSHTPHFRIGQGGRRLTDEERGTNIALGDQLGGVNSRIDEATRRMRSMENPPKLGHLIKGFCKGLIPGCFKKPKAAA